MAKSSEWAQSANVSLAKGFVAWQALTKALFDDYRPELHYMRGPGPKWREAQGIGEDRWLRLESVRQFHEDFESSSGAALLRARASAES